MSQENVNLVIRGKQLIDGTGAGPVQSSLVAVAGKRIVYAGPATSAPEFPSARVIDLPEATLLPGLIDMHAHPSYYWEERDSGTYTYAPEKMKVYTPITVAFMASAYLHKALMSGVTTARDTGALDGVMPEVRRAIQKGQVLGSKVYTAGTADHAHRRSLSLLAQLFQPGRRCGWFPTGRPRGAAGGGRFHQDRSPRRRHKPRKSCKRRWTRPTGWGSR